MVTPTLNVNVPRLLIPVAADAPVVAPVSAHVNIVTPQLSPVVGLGVTTDLLQAPAVTFAVIFEGQTIVGGTVSVTVTVEVHVDTFPFISVTVNVTELVPTSVQSNRLGLTERLAIPQLSKLPLFTRLGFKMVNAVTGEEKLFRVNPADPAVDPREVVPSVPAEPPLTLVVKLAGREDPECQMYPPPPPAPGP